MEPFVSWQRLKSAYTRERQQTDLHAQPTAIEADLERIQKYGDKWQGSHPGARFEYWCLANRKTIKQCSAWTDPALDDDRAIRQQLLRQEAQEAAWLAGAQHGFAALAGIPELQQILAFLSLPVMKQQANSKHLQHAYEDSDAAERTREQLLHDEVGLFMHLHPQLRICLLAEVAAGLICPGQPLPLDTPEHGAALLHLVNAACQSARDEANSANHAELMYYQSYKEADFRLRLDDELQSHLQLQICPPGQQLLELVCQVMDKLAASSSSRHGSAPDAAAAATHDSSCGEVCANSSNSSLQEQGPAIRQQQYALRQLLEHWQPAMEAAWQAQQTSSSSNSSCTDTSAAVCLIEQLQAAAQRFLQHRYEADPQYSVEGVPAAAAAIPAVALDMARQAGESISEQQQHPIANDTGGTADPAMPAVAAEVFAEQLRTLGGALVFQFIAAARAAGGVAWQQEVPLQALLLLAALEQLQGLCLAAVQQNHVQEASAAAEADYREAHGGGCSADMLPRSDLWFEAQQQQHDTEGSSGVDHQAADIASLEAQQSDCCLEERLLSADCCSYDEQQQQLNEQYQDLQQQQQGQQQQETTQSCLMMQLLQKLCEIIQLLRHFKQLNGQLNGTAAATPQVASARSPVHQPAHVQDPNSRSNCLGWPDLCSPYSRLQQFCPEPFTVSWLKGSSAVQASSSSNNSSDVKKLTPTAAGSSASPASSSSSDGSTHAQQAVKLQQLRSDILSGALLLFGAQEESHCQAQQAAEDDALRLAGTYLSEHTQQLLDSVNSSWGASWSEMLENRLQTSGIHLGRECIARAVCYTQGLADSYWRIWDDLLARQHEIDSGWSTLYRATEELRDIMQWQQQQRQYGAHGVDERHWPGWIRGQGEVAKGVKAGANALRLLQDLLGAEGQKLRRWLDLWQHQRCHWNCVARKWWNGGDRRKAARLEEYGKQQREQRQQQQRLPTGAQHEGAMPGTSSSAAADSDSLDSSSSCSCPRVSSHSSSSSAGRLPASSRYDRSPSCPVCQHEIQELVAAAAPEDRPTAASNSSSGKGVSSSQQQYAPYSRWPVPYDDICFWRRLVWQLLGKLNHTAQEFWATKYGVCPHCPDMGIWDFIGFSLLQVIWVPGDANPVMKHIAWHDMHCRNDLRPRRVLQYARAVNRAFTQSYTGPAAALLSQQVLLALSPLQQQVLPDPEAALLSPSSAAAVFQQVLAKQLGLQHLLADDKHYRRQDGNQQLQVQNWHAWYHLGIRQYFWVEQQQCRRQQQHRHQQQHMPQQESHADNVGSSNEAISNMGSSRLAANHEQHVCRYQQQQQQQQPVEQLNPKQLEQLYTDADARYYAAGFAARQLGPWGMVLHQQPALANSYASHYRNLLRTLQDGTEQIVLAHQMQQGMQQGLQQPAGTEQEQAHHAAAELVYQTVDNNYLEGIFPPAFQPGAAAGLGPRHKYFELTSDDAYGEVAMLFSDGHLSLEHPNEWLQQYERVADVCDVCQKPLRQQQGQQRQEALTCPVCRCASYCSQQCKKQDDWHADLCEHLVKAKQRYRGQPYIRVPISTGRCQISQLSSGSGGGYRWRVLDLLLPEPGMFASCCEVPNTAGCR